MVLLRRLGEPVVLERNQNYGTDTDGMPLKAWGTMMALLVAARDVVFAGEAGSVEYAFLQSLLQRLNVCLGEDPGAATL